MKPIKVQFYNSEYFDSINGFNLQEDQLLFTALPNQMAEITHEKHPVVILSGMEPVGFFVLHSSDR
ncbi:hypothetical protein LIT25_14710 [Bacillus sp. F19]|nr:hypothetical protein LIT25_14710 [Bacillus sp. F19]